MQPRVKLIFNPHSDRGRSWEIATLLQSIIESHGGASWSATEYPTHATELALQAGEQGFDIVAALGGDGTVHEVVNGLMQLPADKRPILGAVPIGSGNDFCISAGVDNNVETAMQRVFTGDVRRLDVGRVRDNLGRVEYFDNTFGIGFDASVTIHSYNITRLKGFTMYLWAVIQTIMRNHDSPLMVVETDEETFKKEILMLVLCNGPREGGGFYVAPDAKPDDGVFHYAMIGRVSRPMMFRLIPEVMNGTHGRFDCVQMGKFTRLKLESDEPVTIHADGEVFAGFTSEVTQIEVDILPKELQVIA